jgi:hypothetical protein
MGRLRRKSKEQGFAKGSKRVRVQCYYHLTPTVEVAHSRREYCLYIACTLLLQY